VSWPGSEEPSLASRTQQLYQEGVSAAESVVKRVQGDVSEATTSLITSLRRFANERPLRLIAIVAGAGFAAGVALRIWRWRVR
jgi:ElaB/YqjD/DUF883 family membrane-anchored ribosome-binding protein